MKKFFAFVLLLAFLIPQVASSEEGSGYYGSVTGGLLFTNDMNLPDSLNSRDSFEADFTAYNNFNNATGQFGTGSFGAIALTVTLYEVKTGRESLFPSEALAR